MHFILHSRWLRKEENSQDIRELSFFGGRGEPSICDGQSSIFSGPPLCMCEKILVPPLTMGKNTGPPPFGYKRTPPSHA